MQEKIDKYKIIEQVGAGKAGVVFSALDESIGRLVAIKVMKAAGFGSTMERKIAVKRFATEIRAVGRLVHPNICTIYDSGLTAEGLPYLVMQLVDGRSLDLIIRDLGSAMDPQRAIKILKQIASALDYAHSQNVVHRDIKPSNILIGKDDQAYIVDFSTAFMPDESYLRLDAVAGTPQYMAPEIIEGQKPTASADLYSMGILAYVLFTGSRPFREGDIKTTLEAILRKSAFSFSELGCPLGAKLERALRRVLSKSPRDRFSTASHFISACEDALQQRTTAVFSQVAPTSEAIQDPSSSLFNRSHKDFRSRYLSGPASLPGFFLKLCLLVIFLFSIALGIILFFTNRYSNIHQRLAVLMHIEIQGSEIQALSDQSLLSLLSLEMPNIVKIRAIAEAKARGSAFFMPALFDLLQDGNPEVRLQVLELLASTDSTPDKLLEPALITALSDPDRFVKIYAAALLSKSQDPRLTEKLSKQAESERDPAVKLALTQFAEQLRQVRSSKKK